MSNRQTWVKWTDTEDALIREVWASGETFKQNAHRFGEHTMRAITMRASTLKLGPRPIRVRSQYSAVWETARKYLVEFGPADLIEIAEATGVSFESLSTAFKAARKREPMHIYGYIKRHATGCAARVWALGPGKDARRPKPESQKIYDARSVARQRKHRLRAANPIVPANPLSFVVQQVALLRMQAQA